MYLESKGDGLATRPSGDWAKEKLSILRRCVSMFTTAMRNKRWAALNYIDLEAGPGKNSVGDGDDVFLGSPLIALNTTYKFDNYYFVEKDKNSFESLRRRVQTSSHFDRVKLFNGDCNIVIKSIVRDIHAIEGHSGPDGWPCLNLAFVDPEGLEIHWDTIALLGRETRSDLIINFSTSAIIRNIRMWSQSPGATPLDTFLGTREWCQTYAQLPNPRDGTAVRRSLLDFYAKRLGGIGYHTTGPDGEHIILNSKNRQLYSLICASKGKLGVNFFEKAAAKFKQSGLPGFD